MIILDTNVLSALMQRSAEMKVVDWLDKQPRLSIWTTSVTILEIRFGLQILPQGKRRSATIATRNISDFQDLSVSVVNPWANGC